MKFQLTESTAVKLKTHSRSAAQKNSRQQLLRTRKVGQRRRSLIFEPLEDRSLLAAILPSSSLELISGTTAGVAGNGLSHIRASHVLSDDGRYVVFGSDASNLVSGDMNGSTDIFVKDRQTGAIRRASSDASGIEANSISFDPTISSDGRYVAFYSWATNLVAGDVNGAYDIFVKDMVGGGVRIASISGTGIQANNQAFGPSINGDGSRVAFYSSATNLIAGKTTTSTNAFVKDFTTGEIILVSSSNSGIEGNGNSVNPVISRGGRYVVFESEASNLVTNDTNGKQDVFVKDLQTGKITRVSTDSSGMQANDISHGPSISSDGRYIAFGSDASNLIPNDSNESADIFVKDTLTGATTRVSTDAQGQQSNWYSLTPSISGDGRLVSFYSYASNLVSHDNNNDADFFVKDRLTGAVALVSQASGLQGNGRAFIGGISGNGDVVAFTSLASNLAAHDTNANWDVFAISLAVPLAGGIRLDRGVLEVTGTTKPDNLTISLSRNWLTVNGKLGSNQISQRFSYKNVQQIVAYLGDGKDRLVVDAKITAPLFVNAGEGDDVVSGGGGVNIIVGGDGNDSLLGGKGRDILIGGAGKDQLLGRQGSDLLFAGPTAFDTSQAALLAIAQEWQSPRSRDLRMANLRTGTGPILQGLGIRLEQNATIFDDLDVDALYGGSDRDWFFVNPRNDRTDRNLSESVG